jgi:hypothetical protein
MVASAGKSARKPDSQDEPGGEPTQRAVGTQAESGSVPSTAGTPSAALFEPESDERPELPQVDAHAVDAATARTADKSGSTTTHGGIVDNDGNPFNPAVHESNGDGSPRLTTSGKCRRKRGGGSQKSAQGAAGPTPSKLDIPGPGPTPEAQDLERKIQQSAAVATAMTFTLAQVIGGPDFAPIHKDNKDAQFPDLNEPQELCGAYKDLFTAYGVVDLPPWAGFSMTLCVIVARRWNKENFVKRKQTWREKIKHWWINRTERKRREREFREAERIRREKGTNPKNEADIPMNGHAPQVPPP